MSLTKQKILAKFFDLLLELADDGKAELLMQGHNASGKGIASIKPKITSTDLNQLVGAIMAEGYLLVQDSGLPASSIPFSGTGGGSRSSKYIKGLMRWIQIIKPGLEILERKSFAFAIANTHKKEGMPTGGAYNWTLNGRRTDWIQYGLDEKAQNLEDRLRVLDLIVESFEEQLDSISAEASQVTIGDT